jgi:hypothetical protein
MEVTASCAGFMTARTAPDAGFRIPEEVECLDVSRSRRRLKLQLPGSHQRIWVVIRLTGPDSMPQ